MAVIARRLLVGALHPSYYLPVGLGLVWCSSFAAAAVFGVDDAGEDGPLLRILALVGVLAGIPLLGCATNAALALDGQGARLDRHLWIRWSDISRVSVTVREEHVDILVGPVDVSVPVRRIYPVLHQPRDPQEVVIEQLGQRIT